MQNIDLNICLNHFEKIDEYDLVNAIYTLFSNEITTAFTFNHENELSIQYSELTQTLKIINKGWNVKPTDFLIKRYQSIGNYNFLGALIRLMASGYHLEFRSKFGKFTPIITQKNNFEVTVPTLHIKYEETTESESAWTSLKNDYNDVDEHIDDSCTIINLWPVSQDVVNALNNRLSWTHEWKEVIPSRRDYLLVNDTREFNAVYVNGFMISPYGDYEKKLLYSYDISSHFMDNVNGDQNDDWYTERAVWYVLHYLNDEDKKRIFPTILNNEDGWEWTFPDIQIEVVEFLNKQHPNQYVIWNEEDDWSTDVIDLVKQSGETIVKVSEDAYHSLAKKVENVFDCMQVTVANMYDHNGLAINDLSPSEQSNLQLLKEFLVYFAHYYAPLRKELSKEDLTSFPIMIVDNYPTHLSTYSTYLKKGILDRANLHDTAKTFAAGLEMIWRADDSMSYYEFTNLWLNNTINFFKSLNTHCKDANQEATCKTNNNK